MSTNRDEMPLIGVFDSGVGGLSVVREVRQLLPAARVVYLADNRYVPYGDKSTQWLEARGKALTRALLVRGAQLVLVACNTATTHTIAALRAQWPEVPFVGVEPGIKPAALNSVNRRVAVMATPATIQSQRLKQLIDTHAAHTEVHLLACPGLADAIEQADESLLARMLDDTAARLASAGVDTVVLGCTHYPLVSGQLARRLGPAVRLVDTAEPVARRVQSLLGPLAVTAAQAPVAVLATGTLAPIEAALKRWLGSPYTLEAIDVPIEP